MDQRPPRRTDSVPGRRIGLAVVFFLAAAAAGGAEEKKPKAAAPEPPKLTIKWSTSSEVDNYGFWVMRGDTEQGPFKEVHPKVVPGAGNSDLPRKYAFDDRNVEMGRVYYYYLDAISTHGVREKYSPVIKKQCCDKPGEKAPESEEVKDKPADPPAPPSKE